MLKLMIAFVFVPNLCGFLLETDPVVDTDCGPVHGISSGKSFSFRGIPYASPPVGDKRWRPPRELTKQNNNCWTGTLNATEFGNICFQTHGNEKYMGSEDCLYLNVWTPSLNPQTKLPVAVWIHGGYLEYGAGNQPSISPSESLAQITETVYVSMNYRLHALGFISLKLLADDSPTNTSGNYGFMDMIAALQWVQRNIENFGGDKDQVSIVISMSIFIRFWYLSRASVRAANPQASLRIRSVSPEDLLLAGGQAQSSYIDDFSGHKCRPLAQLDSCTCMLKE